MSVKRVAVIGATGLVGQKVIALLSGHALFEVAELVASEGRVGKCYGEVVDWRENLCELSREIGGMVMKSVDEVESEYVISCLPGNVAREIEGELVRRGKIVFSNASAHRMESGVPILVPEVNLGHLELLEKQEGEGKIITNSNCLAAFLVPALAPLRELGELGGVNVVTMQSISGAGELDLSEIGMEGTIVPYIEFEEKKIIEETCKMLGDGEQALDLAMMVQVNRVPVVYGHMLVLQVRFEGAVGVDEVRAEYAKWNERYEGMFRCYDEVDRPQPKKDIGDDDMCVHIGQIKQGRGNEIGMVVMGNNLVRGAAGAAIANMEAYESWRLAEV